MRKLDLSTKEELKLLDQVIARLDEVEKRVVRINQLGQQNGGAASGASAPANGWTYHGFGGFGGGAGGFGGFGGFGGGSGGGGGFAGAGGGSGAASQPNPYNPFAGANPMGPAAAIGYPGYNLNAYQFQQQALATQRRQENLFALSAGGAAVASMGLHAYTQSVVSGQPNPMGYGQTYGAAVGLGVTGGLMAGGMSAGAAGPWGLLAGAVAAPLLNAFQAPYVAQQQATLNVAPYATMSGANPASFANIATTRALAINNRPGMGYGEIALRALGLYTGVDQTSSQDITKVMSSLGEGFAARGVLKSGSQLDAIIKANPAFQTQYGPQVAESYSRALGGYNASGGNLIDLAQRVGLSPTLTMMQVDGLTGGKALTTAMAGMAAAGYRTQGAGYASQSAQSAYDASAYSGASLSGRGGSYEAMVAALGAERGAVQGEIAAASQFRDGANSNFVKAKQARLAEIDAQIAQEAGRRAQGMVSEAGAVSGANFAATGIGATRANLYGGAESFGRVGDALLGNIASETRDLQASLQNPNLPFEDRQRVRSRLFDLEAQRVGVPAQMAGAAYRRRSAFGDYRTATSGASYQMAALYGDDAALGDSAAGAVAAQGSVYRDALLTFNDPNASVEDRLSAGVRAANASLTGTMIRAQARDVQLNRMAGRSGVSQGEAAFGLMRANRLGSAQDVRSAAQGMAGAFGEERNQIQAQLASGGLTVEQEIRLRGRLNDVNAAQFSTQQNALDSAFGKEDTVFATRYGDAQSRQRIAQLLPFSPGNTMRLNIEAIGLARGQVGALNTRERQLRESGDLSPEREYEISRARNSLREDIAAGVGRISLGMEDKLMAMTAGRPLNFRGDSFSLAALRMQGTPVRLYGAVNGRQARAQDQFLEGANDLGTPFSPTQPLNSPPMSQEVVSAIDRLGDRMERAITGRNQRGGNWGGGDGWGNDMNQQRLWNAAN